MFSSYPWTIASIALALSISLVVLLTSPTIPAIPPAGSQLEFVAAPSSTTVLACPSREPAYNPFSRHLEIGRALSRRRRRSLLSSPTPSLPRPGPNLHISFLYVSWDTVPATPGRRDVSGSPPISRREVSSIESKYTSIIHRCIRRSTSETTLSLELMCPPLPLPPCSLDATSPKAIPHVPRVCPICPGSSSRVADASPTSTRARPRKTHPGPGHDAPPPPRNECRPVIHRGLPHAATPAKAIFIPTKDVKQARQLASV